MLSTFLYSNKYSYGTQLCAVCTYLYKAMKFYPVYVIVKELKHFWTERKKVAMKNQKCITHAKPKSLLPRLFLCFFPLCFYFKFYGFHEWMWNMSVLVCGRVYSVCVCSVQKIVERFSNLLHLFHCIVGTCVYSFQRMCLCKWIVLEQKSMQNFIFRVCWNSLVKAVVACCWLLCVCILVCHLLWPFFP